uniref:Uncharacterized protein n=1 Tax=Anguilla anguilla TaxID=7936 RepID=A0A0E9XAK5_ANGAN
MAASTSHCLRSRGWASSGETCWPALWRKTATASPPPSSSCTSTLSFMGS